MWDEFRFVGLLKAVGTELFLRSIRDKVYKRPDMEPLPADGEYFMSPYEHSRKNNIDEQQAETQFEKARRPLGVQVIIPSSPPR